MAVIKSLLKLGIDAMPNSTKAESVVPSLLNKGVKAEELEYSGVQSSLPTSGRVTRDDLVAAEEARVDRFDVTESADYGATTISAKGVNNPTYRERTYTFSQEGQAESSRYTSEHFPEVPNYLFHTRVYDDQLGNTNTRVITELQSDLHQQRRTQNVLSDNITEELVHSLQRDLQEAAEQGVDATDLTDELIDLLRYDGVHPRQDVTPEQLNQLTNMLLNDEYAENVYPVIQNIIDPPILVNSATRNEFYNLLLHNENSPELTTLAKGIGWDGTSSLQEFSTRLVEETIPESPLAKTWAAKAIEREIAQAYEDGLSQVAIPISGNVGRLARSGGVQTWYETQVSNTAKKVARKANMDFALETHEGVTYAVMRTRPDVTSKPQFNLYATPTSVAFASYMGLREGYTDEEIRTQISESMDEEEAQETFDIMGRIQEAINAGYTIEEVQEAFDSQPTEIAKEETNYTPETTVGVMPRQINPYVQMFAPSAVALTTAVADAYNTLTSEKTEFREPSELVAALQVLNPTMISNSYAMAAYFGLGEFPQRYDIAANNSRAQIIQIADRDFDIQLEWRPEDSSFYVRTDEGLVLAEPGIMESIRSVKGEIAGGVAGAIYGGKLGASAAPPTAPLVGPLSKLLGAAGGALVGGGVGAVLGTELDYLLAALDTQQDMEYQVAAQKALDAAEMAAIGEVLGYAAFTTLKAGWKGIVRAKNMIVDGNTQGAYKALREVTGLSDEQIDDIVEAFEELVPNTGSKEQRAIVAVAETNPALQGAVRAAANYNPAVSASLAQQVNSRAQQVLSMTANATDPNAAKLFAQDLNNYVSDVQAYYNGVKIAAAQAPRGLSFSWDYTDLALAPALDRLTGQLGLKGVSTVVTDPTASKFVTQLSRINHLAESNTFSDLIELRQVVNEFLFNKRIGKADTKDMLREALANIDAKIQEGAAQVFNNSEEWLESWRNARSQYSQMKQVQETAMYRMMFDAKGQLKPVQADNVIKGLYKYITALDGSFERVMSRLPAKGRAMYESSIVDYLTNKHTTGADVKAIDFIALQDELSQVGFASTEARQMKQAINQFADVFRNDMGLARLSGSIEMPKFQSYLTTDPVVRAKFEIASGVFNYLKTWAPGTSQQNAALIKNIASLLSKPLDARAAEEVLSEVGNNAALRASIAKLQQQAAEAVANGKDTTAAKVRVYGNGSTRTFKGPGQETTIPLHRIASLEQVKIVADSQGITTDSPMLGAFLKSYGFEAMMQGTDRVRLL